MINQSKMNERLINKPDMTLHCMCQAKEKYIKKRYNKHLI
jgi:hypothetical protein